MWWWFGGGDGTRLHYHEVPPLSVTVSAKEGTCKIVISREGNQHFLCQRLDWGCF